MKGKGNNQVEMSDEDAVTQREALIPDRLPAYLSEAFSDLYEEDGLLVLGRGMGLLPLISAFVRFYGDAERGHVSIVNCDDSEDSQGIHRSNEDKKTLAERGKAGGTETSPPLVFVIGLKESERNAILATLQRWGTPPNLLPTMVTNESGQGKDRAVLYRRGGVFIITSRILIVDLLTNIANPQDIEGLLVAHAETVTEQSTEAFILRIYRTQRLYSMLGSDGRPITKAMTMGPTVTKAAGFIKAFTDDPASLMAGFAKVDKILKALFVRRFYLYPRFHNSVAEELEKFQPHVEELHQELSPLMKEIQGAIAAAVQTCIRELKSSTTLIEWSDPEITLENCVSKNFDSAISRQLDQDWHRLKPPTKQLVNDLRTLRTLFQYLIQYDCVSFWKLLQNIKTMSAATKYPSMWLLTPAADLLFRKAKERIYSISFRKPKESGSTSVGVLSPVLEENPKWRLLARILAEIKAEWKGMLKQRRRNLIKDDNPYTLISHEGGARVLVMVKDERSLETLRSYLVEGRERTMMLRWLRYLENHNEAARNFAKGPNGAAGLSEEARVLLEEEGRARNKLFGSLSKKQRNYEMESGAASKKRRTDSVPKWVRKKRKVAEEKSRGHRTLGQDDIQQRNILDEAVEGTERDLEIQNDGDAAKIVGDATKNKENKESVLLKVSNSPDVDRERHFKVRQMDDFRVVMKTYGSVDGEHALPVLNDLRPMYIILYDADPSFIRSIEIHSSLMSLDRQVEGIDTAKDDKKIRVFFMMFEASSEEKSFLKSLEREQNAFERLILHKKTMAVPINTLDGMTQEMQLARAAGVAGSYAGGSLPLSMDTRTGKGLSREENERRDIAVDVREFRSSLPSILHRGGMRLAPVTLSVGDFILSPVHCVERKSVSDLFGSFASGRLFTQAESMSKHYKCPCLLIEFDPSKSFSLQSPSDLGGDIRTDSICSKICLLVMHFPKLRLLWSRETHETLKIFKALKQNHEEVNVERAMEIGSNESLDEILGINSNVQIHSEKTAAEGHVVEDEENEINEFARDILLRLPGINVNNARKVMSACDSIAELADMSRDELKKMLGPITGQKLFTFFRQQLSAL